MKKDLLTGLACSLLLTSLAMGEIRAYDAAGNPIGDTYGTIQDAVNAMFFNGGDNGRITVDTADSPYTGPGNTDIRMWVPMTIVAIDASTGRPAQLGDVVIDCEGTARAFIFLEGQNIADANRVNTTDVYNPVFDDGEAVDANEAFVIQGFKIINGFAAEWNDPTTYLNAGCGGGILIDAGYPIISDCFFQNCISDDFAGGAMAIGQGEEGGGEDVPLIRNCVFYGNSAYTGGGAIVVRRNAAPNIINCLMVQNYADVGGAMYIDDCTPNVELSTIADNSGYFGVYVYSASPTFTNCILWNNSGGDSDSIEAANCLVQDEDIDGDNIIYVDPLFSSGLFRAFWDAAGDYYVDTTSPTIDAGDGSLANPYNTDYGISATRSTQISEAIDRFSVDLGFHYPRYTGPDIDATLTIAIDGNPAWGRVEIVYLLDRFDMMKTPPPYDANGIYTLKLGDLAYVMAVPAAGYRVKQWTNTNDDGIYNLDYLFRQVKMVALEVEIRCEFEPDIPKTLNYPGQYSDLQYAVNIARSGDTIIVHPGTYVLPGYGAYKPPVYAVNAYPCITISQKAITIRSISPGDPATVAATVFEPGWGAYGVFAFENCGRDTVLSGITLRNGLFYGANGQNGRTSNPVHPAGYDAGGVYGGAIKLYGSSPTISNCVFRDCGVFAGNGGNATVVNNLGYDGGNGGCAGGGALFVYYASPLLQNTTFVNCQAVAGNGGNGAEGDNRYGRGGSYKVWSSNSGGAGTRIERQGAGGAVLVAGGNPEFEDCTFEGCYVSSGASGVGSSPYIQGETGLIPMDMSSAGAAVYIGGNLQLGTVTGGASFTRCVFTDNSPRLLRAANRVYESPYIAYGGAIGADEGSVVRITDCTFNNNSASIGGALYWGAKTTTGADIRIEGTTFYGNEAFQGGAIYGFGGTASLLGSTFTSNTVALASSGADPNQIGFENVLMQGGAVYLGNSNSLLGDCVFTYNESTHSGGALAIAGNDSSLPPRVHNNLFMGNKAGRDGGAIVLTDNSEPNVINCSVVFNQATGTGFDGQGRGGGLSVTAGSRATIANSLIWGNTAYAGPQMSLVDPNGGSAYQLSYATVKYSMVQGGQSGIATPPGGFLIYEASNIQTGTPGFLYDNINEPDQFVEYYGLADDSPCVDSGNIDMDAFDLSAQPVLPLGRYAYTIRADEARDTGMIDIGYHRRKVGEYPVGDVDYSGVVDILDLAVMIEYRLGKVCEYPDWCEGTDIDKSGLVTDTDIALLAQLYGAGDVTAPVPNPPQWLIMPTAESTTSITMAAVPGKDNSGNAVEYLFDCVTAGGHSSSWQSSNTYTDTELTEGNEYGYRIKVRDVIPDDPDRHNETDWSSTLYGYAGEDGKAPSPNPSQWEVAPYALSATSIAMTAVRAVDASGVEYYFRCESGLNGYDSGWQDSPSFINTGLSPNTQYTYTVYTRDKSAAKNTGGMSVAKSARTFITPDLTPPTPAQAQWYVAPYAISSTMIGMVAVTAFDPSGVEYNFECMSGGHQYDSGWQQAPTYVRDNLPENTTFVFRLRVRDRSANANECIPSNEATVTTIYPGGGPGTPPDPDPMQWGTGPTQIELADGVYHTMQAAVATDVDLGVQYYFQCVTLPELSSGWLDAPVYSVRVGDVGELKTYGWRVKARDYYNAETRWSTMIMAGISTPPTPNPMQWSLMPMQQILADGIYHTMSADTALDPDGGIQYYFECVTNPDKTSGWISSSLYSVKVGSLDEPQVYTWRVKARDKYLAETDWSPRLVAGAAMPPTPNPMQWDVEPYQQLRDDGIYHSMTAVTATDIDGGIEYFFQCMSAPALSSGWISASTYSVKVANIGESKSLTWRVKARDVLGNETQWSFMAIAGPTPPIPNPMQWDLPPVQELLADGHYHTMWAAAATDTDGAVSYYFECITAPEFSSGWISSSSYSVKVGSTSQPRVYSWRVRARDIFGAMTDWSSANAVGGVGTPPSPNPAQWLMIPVQNATDDGFYHSMAAMPATDADGGIEYYFDCVTYPAASSGWTASMMYTVKVGEVGQPKAYDWRVKARDRFGNETGWSLTVSTQWGAPYPNPMLFSPTSAWSGVDVGYPTQVIAQEGSIEGMGPPGYYHVMTAYPAYDYMGSNIGVEYYFECITYPKLSSGWINWIYDPDLGSFYYARVGDLGWPKKYLWRVKARDMWGLETSWSTAYMAGGN